MRVRERQSQSNSKRLACMAWRGLAVKRGVSVAETCRQHHAYWALYHRFIVRGKDPDYNYKLARIAVYGVRVFAVAVASCCVSPLRKLVITSLVKTVKNIHITHLMCSYIHRYCFGHGFYVNAHGARVAGQYSYCPYHILGDMSIALTLVNFTAYSRSVQHFDRRL